MWWVRRARTPCGFLLCNTHTPTYAHTHITPTPLPTTATSAAAPYDPSCSPELYQSAPTDQRASDWQAVKIHQHGLHLAQVPHRHHLRNPHPPFSPESQEKTHLSQSVSEQDVSWGEKVSSRVSVHCCDGGCFFHKGVGGGGQLMVKGWRKNQEEVGWWEMETRRLDVWRSEPRHR